MVRFDLLMSSSRSPKTSDQFIHSFITPLLYTYIVSYERRFITHFATRLQKKIQSTYIFHIVYIPYVYEYKLPLRRCGWLRIPGVSQVGEKLRGKKSKIKEKNSHPVSDTDQRRRVRSLVYYFISPSFVHAS